MGAIPIAVLGAGSWGTALAVLLARNGHATLLWAHRPGHAAAMTAARCNPRYLPDIPFPATLGVVSGLGGALVPARDVLIAVPSAAFRATLAAMRPHLVPGARVAWATKGFEPGSGKLLHEVFAEEMGVAIPAAVVSGPTFAREVALGLPTAVTVASSHPGFARDLCAYLHSSTFRPYTSDDVTGVELGGAVKNVLAIAAGIADGLGFGANSRAALITRGLAEMMRLGVALGARRETLMGLAGLGDLVLTCTDNQSRNRRFGLALGQGRSMDEAAASIGQVVEGAHTAREAAQLARRHGVEMPIAEQVCRVLYEGVTPREAVTALLQREQKAELA